jgi:hypothetical protein
MRTRKANCHPRKSKKRNTCYEDPDLLYLRNEWNRKHPSRTITSHQSKVIRRELDKYMQECSDELCWTKLIQDEHKKKDILKKNFAVFHPKEWKKNEKEWLSNFDISNVLNQYKETYSDFDYIEPSPIDFDKKLGNKCVTNEICNLNLNDYMKKGIYRLAIPLNLDKHTGDGFHWVVLYVDLKRKFMYYFDSAKNKMPTEVETLMDRLVKQTAIPLKKLDNQSKQHQQGDTECGMYVLFFVVSMLEGKSPKHFNKRTITDEEVFKCRRIYFNRED